MSYAGADSEQAFGARVAGSAPSEAYATEGSNGGVSFLSAASTILRHRRLIFGVPVLLALVTVAISLLTSRTYTASSSFTPRASDLPKSGLGNIAAQFGVAVPGADPSQSPDFYADLLLSRPVLHRIVDTSYTLATGAGARSRAMVDLLEAEGSTPAERSDDAIRLLRSHLGISKNTKTGVIRVTVSTKWPQLSLAVAVRLVDMVNAFNLRARQAKAIDEASFAEERVAELNSQLRRAEQELASFRQRNRTFGGASDLVLEEQRLNRTITLRQEVYTTVVRTYEQMRLDAVRTTPVVTIVEPAELPVRADRRHTLLKAVLALVFGTAAMLMLVFAREALRSAGGASSPESARLRSLSRESVADLKNPLRVVGSMFGGKG